MNSILGNENFMEKCIFTFQLSREDFVIHKTFKTEQILLNKRKQKSSSISFER